MSIKNLRPYLLKWTTFFVILFFATLVAHAQSQPSITFNELYIAAEAASNLEIDAKELALRQEKPLSIYIENQVLIEAKYIENNEPVYTIIHNFTDPKQGGEVAFFNEIEERFDLEMARMNMGNGIILNALSGHGAEERVPTPDAALGILLIPEATNDRVMAFNRATGDLIDADYIPSDAGFSTPLAARPNQTKSGHIFVSDQIEDIIREYTGSGTFVRDFAPAGGQDNAILDNIRGFEFKEGNSGNMLVAVGEGANANTIAEFNTSGGYLGTFINSGASGMDSPFDIIFYENQNTYLVSAIGSDAIHQFDNNGNYLNDFAVGLGFPEQLLELANGNVLVANFVGTEEGILEYNSAGVLLGKYDNPALGGYRGVYELANGNLLVTNGAGVHEIDRTGALIETKIAGVSARFIHEYNFLPVIGIPTMGQWALFFFALLMLTTGSVYIYNYQTQMALINTTGKTTNITPVIIPFDKKTFWSFAPFTLLIAGLGFGLIQLVWGEIILNDVVGMALVLPLINYLGHFYQRFQ